MRLPRPSTGRVLHDCEGLLARMVSDFENLGLRMPPELANRIRQMLIQAYQDGVEAQRQDVLQWLQSQPDGARILAGGDTDGK